MLKKVDLLGVVMNLVERMPEKEILRSPQFRTGKQLS